MAKNLSDIDLDELENFAGLFVSFEELAEILEVNALELKRAYLSKRGEIYKRIRKGQLLNKASIRKALFTLAINGSLQASEKAIDIINQWEKNDGKI